jgi:hypothetical protein
MASKFKIIMREWNLYLVPTESDVRRDKSIFFSEKYYIMPEVLELWGHRFGYEFTEIDSNNLIKGVDFDTDKQDTIRHTKIARGAPTVHTKNEPVAVLTEDGKKALTQRRRRRAIQQKKMVKEFTEKNESGTKIKVSEHAAIIRKLISKEFPDIKFRVKSNKSKYGGNINIYHHKSQTKAIWHPKKKEIEEFLEKFDGERKDLKEEKYNVGFLNDGERLVGAQYVNYSGSDFMFSKK